MSMHDVLIVDDEPVARQSLRYLIDWEALGFAVHAEAEDGAQALELVKAHHYGLVLTDIRMPVMSGLELIAALREFPDTAVVIMSGYDDFEYAREGMKLGVKDYLLKPVDEDELTLLLRKLGAELREKQLLERRQRLGISAGRDRLLRRLAHGQVGGAELDSQLRLLELDPQAESFVCLLVELDFMTDGSRELADREADLKRFAVRNILEELCAGKGYVYEESEERFGLLAGGRPEALTEAAMLDWAGTLSRSVLRYAKETVSIGLGERVSGLSGLRRSCQSAEEALDGKFLQGAGAVLAPRKPQSAGPIEQTLRALEADVLEGVRSFRRGEAFRALARMWEGFRSMQVPPDRARLAVLELLVQLFRLVKEQGASHERVFDYALGDYERVMRSGTMDELLVFAEGKCGDVLELLLRMKELRPNKVVEDVKRIVQEQYAGNVSLRSVAQTIYMNPNYLGKLFKANTGLSFNDYVLQVRMEKAKELLLHTDKKVYEIAQEVGFGELDWFYKRFKTYTGVSTGEFRSGR